MRFSCATRRLAALVLVFLIAVTQAHGAERESPPRDRDDSYSPAADLVQEALAAEAAGDAERRAAYLKDALAADADYAPAHWHAGEVRQGEQWVATEAAASEAARAGKVSQYRQLRDRAQNNALGHLSLANWCAAAGLKDQQRMHLVYAMQSRPTKKQSHDIIRRLGVVRYRGALMLPAQAEMLKAESKKSDEAMQEWKPRLTALRRNIESPDRAKSSAALEQLRAIRDPAAIPALETVFVKSKPAIVKQVLETIGDMPDQAATDALLRCAILADDEDIRQAAAVALKPRPVFSYVPTLIGALESPVEVQFQTDCVVGQFRHRLVLHQEGPLVDQSIVSVGGSREDISIVNHPISRRPSDVTERFTPDPTAAADASRASFELQDNVRREEVNNRVGQVLRTISGDDQKSTPNDWWSWWFAYNEMYEPPYKQVRQVYVDRMPAVPYTYRVSSVSCFPAGTPVETSTGPLPIEQIKPGDCVLAQDPDSGELAYKPVMAVTLRPPSPLIEVRTAHETIRATRGHPFWVDGLGWQMAKELQAGQWLHTTAGPVQIESVEQQGEAECHNLVVADFNSYFVGSSQILVHDNNLRQVTTATVPGLVAP
jgi:hypothetical protein